MKYFNGFSLSGEERLFSDYIPESSLCVSGFSYGAQEAFEYIYHTAKRIDRLILLSPAFFQEKKKSFIRTQLRYFNVDREAYIQTFLNNFTAPSSVALSSYLQTGTYEELEALLSYEWKSEKIVELVERGIQIEVFLGAKDKIIDAEAAYHFFKPLVNCYYFKERGHILR